MKELLTVGPCQNTGGGVFLPTPKITSWCDVDPSGNILGNGKKLFSYLTVHSS